MRTCIDCSASLDETYHNRKRCGSCGAKRRACQAAAFQRNFRKTNPDKVNAVQRKYRIEHRTQLLVSRRKWAKTYIRTPKAKFMHLQGKCRRFGYNLTLSQEDCEVLWAQPCTYCGITVKTQSGISLDRIDNNLGYLKDNVLSCCGRCNMIRGRNLTVDEMKVAMKTILAFRENLCKTNLMTS